MQNSSLSFDQKRTGTTALHSSSYVMRLPLLMISAIKPKTKTWMGRLHHTEKQNFEDFHGKAQTRQSEIGRTANHLLIFLRNVSW